MILAFRLLFIAACVSFAFAWMGCPEACAQQPPAESQANAAQALRAQLQASRPRIATLIRKTCIDCHGDDEPEAEISLEKMGSLEDLLKHRKTWDTVFRAVEQKEMPPRDGPRLSEAERGEVLQFLRRLLYELDCGSSGTAGAVTIRRLNRFEYRNSVRDLFGIDYEHAADFPGDDVGNGFDNSADTLSLPTILLEKYLDAAERITHRAIVDPDSLQLEKRLTAKDFDRGRASRRGNRLILTTEGVVTARIPVAIDGNYEFKVSLEAMQAGPESVEAEISLNNKVIREITIERPKTESQIVFQADLPKGIAKIGIRFANDFYDPQAKDPNERDRNMIVDGMDVKGPNKLDRAAFPVGHRRILFTVPGRQQTALQTAKKILGQAGLRIFRRPLEDAELDRFLKLFELASEKEPSFEAAIRIPLQAMLVSPHFLFKIESPPPPDGQPRSLSDFELATALSYFLWSSTPDDKLLNLAAQSKLSQPRVLQDEVQRMLADDRSYALVDRFARQWLNLDLLAEVQPDPKKFPKFNDLIRDDMLQETMATFAAVVREDRSVLELLTSDYTFLNERLAKYYDVENVKGEHFRRVKWNQPGRGGIVTQGSIMTLTSHPNRTSPVKRGMWVMNNLLGQVPPPPDPNVMPLEVQQDLRGSLRQKMEQHRRNPSCAACHDRIDPLGFAFEHFDAVGRWRDSDEGTKIDSASKLLDGQAFQDAIELQNILATTRRKQFVEAFIGKMMTYAVGRGMTVQDRCAIVDIANKLEKRDYRFSELIQLICLSEPFRKRQRASDPAGR